MACREPFLGHRNDASPSVNLAGGLPGVHSAVDQLTQAGRECGGVSDDCHAPFQFDQSLLLKAAQGLVDGGSRCASPSRTAAQSRTPDDSRGRWRAFATTRRFSSCLIECNQVLEERVWRHRRAARKGTHADASIHVRFGELASGRDTMSVSFRDRLSELSGDRVYCGGQP